MNTKKKHCDCGTALTDRQIRFCGETCRRTASYAREVARYQARAEATKITVSCAVCKTEVKTNDTRRIYCSESCSKVKHLELSYHFVKCPQCGIDYRRSKYHRKHGRCLACCGRNSIKLARDAMRRHPKTMPLSSEHHCAIEGLLRDPRGVVRYFQNLTKFVLDNIELFDPKDVRKIQGNSTRASGALGAVYRGANGSWKGWTLVSDVEIKEGQWDLLRRKPYNAGAEITAKTMHGTIDTVTLNRYA